MVVVAAVDVGVVKAAVDVVVFVVVVIVAVVAAFAITLAIVIVEDVAVIGTFLSQCSRSFGSC